MSILENELYYEKQANHQSKNVMNKLSKIIEEYGQELTKKEINYLLSFDVKTSNFYGLPKVHKSQIISNLC